MHTQYDVAVIGAGSGGLTAAVGFAKVGKKVVLIEAEHMGGECTNSGCIPSKALLHHADAFHRARSISGATESNEECRQAAFAYVRSIVAGIRAEEQPETFERLGIDVVLGEAAFTSPCTVRANGTEYRYRHAVIATGSHPRMIDIEGLSSEDVLTNQNLFTLDTPPARTLIIGAGPIGLEMGQALAMLGSNVTLATIDSEFAHLEDPAIRPVLANSFTQLGIDIKLNAHITRVEGKIAYFDIKDGDTVVDEIRVEFDKVLLAIGRVPNLPKGLEAAGITFDERCILVDNQHRTSNKYVYALGDVASRLKFTHVADDIARQVVARVTSRGLLRLTRKKAVPKVTYTRPEVAQVGLSWDDARAKYREEQLMRIEVPFTENDRAKTGDETDGRLVVIARRLNGAVLGAHVIGPHAGELIATLTLAIDEKISLWKLQRLIFAYPTYSLIIKKAGDRFVARQLADLKRDSLAAVKRNLPQLFVAGLWLTLLIMLYRYQTEHGMGLSETAFMVFDFVSMTAWGPLVYILAYMVRPLTFFPGTILTILSGVFFGFWYGLLYTVIAANLSALVAYLTGKFFTQNLRLEDTVIGNWVTFLQKNPFEAVLTLRLIFLPFDLVSYAAGILRLPVTPFLLATFAGTLLGIATFVSVGASLDVNVFRESGLSPDIVDWRFGLLSAIIFVVSIGASKLSKRWKVDA
jgi:pyruvate/2-oxoglutarate dehydrogenase complex dihydrolipoamide dehydrogenase (E3) component/uncharacterized membrane protein YdjX (TVP38/TMEM64 family)